MNSKKSIVFDLDGTLCNISLRFTLNEFIKKFIIFMEQQKIYSIDDFHYLNDILKNILNIDKLIYNFDKKTKYPLFKLLKLKYNDFMNLYDELNLLLKQNNLNKSNINSKIKFYLKPFDLYNIKKIHGEYSKTHYSIFMNQLDKIIIDGLNYIKFLRKYYPDIVIIYLTGRLDYRKSNYKNNTILWLQSNGFPIDLRSSNPIYFQKGYSNTTMLNIINLKKISEDFNILFMIGDNHKNSDKKACDINNIKFIYATKNLWINNNIIEESLKKYFFIN